MKLYSLLYIGTAPNAHTLLRVQIYFFLLTPQNVNLLFRVAIKLKKLITPFDATLSTCFAKRR